MRRTTLLSAVLVCVGLLAACTPADPKEAPKAGDEFFEGLRERRYDALYDDASRAFKSSYEEPEFTTNMENLEGFGKMLEAKLEGEPSVEEKDGDKIATLTYQTKFTLAEGPFTLKLKGNDISGAWELFGYDYDIGATTFEPPYSPDESGADDLARHFLYLWQNGRYDDLSNAMQLKNEPDRVRDFLQKLERAGQLLTLERTSYTVGNKSGRKTASANYKLVFDNGTGTMDFDLVEVDNEWRIDEVKYNIEYDTTGQTKDPAAQDVKNESVEK